MKIWWKILRLYYDIFLYYWYYISYVTVLFKISICLTVRVCYSVKRKYGQIFWQDWVSVKTYLMSFCHNSKIFCQTLVVTLTVCCSVKVYSHVWQNSLTVWQNLINVLVLFDRTTQKCLKNRKMSLSPIQIKISKNPRDKIW